MHLFLQDLWIFMYLFILLLKLLILHLGKRSFEPFKITFLEKALYFINVLTKRNNLSHSEAIFICQFPQNMKVGLFYFIVYHLNVILCNIKLFSHLFHNFISKADQFQHYCPNFEKTRKKKFGLYNPLRI